MNETAKVAEPISGDKLYQRRAREALPLLVRQALLRDTIYYSDLASELGMSNPRTLNYPLGSIGVALQNLSNEWTEKIPPIQCLVVNKQNELPGEGIGWFVTKEDFRKLTRDQQRALIRAELQSVFEYPKWPVVLGALGLSADYGPVLEKAKNVRGGGESERHQKLKGYVAEHPEVLRLPFATAVGETEFPLPSGDVVDVLFRVGDGWHAAEVKSALSDTPDIVRGLFQCVKYRAVIEAYQTTQDLPKSASVVLVTEGEFPTELAQMQHMLGVEVRSGIRPR